MLLSKMEGKVSKNAILIMMEIYNKIYYEENENKGRAGLSPRRTRNWSVSCGLFVKGRLEVGIAKQAKGLLRNCMPVLERYARNKKVILGPIVRFYRRSMGYIGACWQTLQW
jgi:hypothetical protein